MPSHYQYQCAACGKVETRYRNARLSRCCRAEVTRLEGKPIDWEGHVANLQAEVDRLRAQNSNLQLATDDMIAENRALRTEAVVADKLRAEIERLRGLEQSVGELNDLLHVHDIVEVIALVKSLGMNRG